MNFTNVFFLKKYYLFYLEHTSIKKMEMVYKYIILAMSTCSFSFHNTGRYIFTNLFARSLSLCYIKHDRIFYIYFSVKVFFKSLLLIFKKYTYEIFIENDIKCKHTPWISFCGSHMVDQNFLYDEEFFFSKRKIYSKMFSIYELDAVLTFKFKNVKKFRQSVSNMKKYIHFSGSILSSTLFCKKIL